jgi:glucosamine-6-phosphate deaminase
MKVIVKANYNELSIAAARILADAISAKPQLSLCLAAGNTPIGMYRELAGRDFSNAEIFYLDDYVGLPENHPESFRLLLQREFFGPCHVKPENIHAPDTRYEETIRNCGGIDLLVCGIGKNGHLAFNEPGSPFDSRTRVVDLAESTIAGRNIPRKAITMGLATIMEARQILLLANGPEKAGILALACRGPVTTDVPASVLQRHSGVTVLTDRALQEDSGG